MKKYVFRTRQWNLSEGTFFLHSVSDPAGKYEACFFARKEGRRKDIERSFAVFQAKFFVVAVLSPLWRCSRMDTITECFIMIHDIIVSELTPLEGNVTDCTTQGDIGEEVTHCSERVARDSG